MTRALSRLQLVLESPFYLLALGWVNARVAARRARELNINPECTCSGGMDGSGELVLCYNKGCGQRFNENDNGDGEKNSLENI